MCHIHFCVAISTPKLLISLTQMHVFMRSSFKSCISYTVLRPRLDSVFPPMYQLHAMTSPTLFLLLFVYHIHGLMPPSLSPSSSCIKSSVQRLIEEIRADGYKTPNSYIVVRSLLYSHGLIASCDGVGRSDQVREKYRQCRLGCRGRGQINR